MRRLILLAGVLALAVSSIAGAAAVDHDAGILTIEGVQVFQDAADAGTFYYLPPYPRIATNPRGELELLLLKHVGDGGEDGGHGGIFHALVEFTLPDEVRERVARELETLRPGARLAGPLPLLQPGDGDPFGAFRVISATLDPEAPPERLTGRVLTSGPAPLHPGSRAALAARLSRREATLLMESLKGATSDLSVAIRAYYPARVRGYGATVRADMDTVYRHHSVVDSLQKGFTKRQIRDVVDELVQDGAMEIDVVDGSGALGLDPEDLERVLDLVTGKLVEVMFDTETGWSRQPAAEVAVAQNQIRGRQQRGWLGKIFGGPRDLPYFSDDQYVVKQREDVRSSRFYLNLSKSTTIRLPVDTTGNLGGFYEALSEAERARHFRVIALDQDADLETAEVFFQVDGQTARGFADSFNSVAVQFRQAAAEGVPARGEHLVFDAQSLAEGRPLQSVRLFRLGRDGDAWTEFEYRAAWSLVGEGEVLRQPAGSDEWIRSSDASVTLVPPLERSEVTIDVDLTDFAAKDIAAVVVQIAAIVDGKPRFAHDLRFRAADAAGTATVVVYHDPGQDLAYRALWFTRRGRAVEGLRLLEGGYAFLFAPETEWLEEAAR